MPIQRPKPIVAQVADILRQRIHDRVYPPGGRLPSESELAREMGVSRATVRTALARFAGEGLILRKPGDGTYVNERIREIDSNYGGLWDFSRLIEANGFRPEIEEISLNYRSASSEEARLLGIEPAAGKGARLLSIVRLFRAGERSAIHASNIIPAELIQVERDQIDSSLPIHQIIHNCCAENIAYAISNIRSAGLDSGMAGTLSRRPGDPILKLHQVFYNKANRPVVAGTSFFDDSILNLRLVQAWG